MELVEVHNFDWSFSQNKLTLFALSFAFVFSLGSNATWSEKLELFPPYPVLLSA
jgi:hypothetical protein